VLAWVVALVLLLVPFGKQLAERQLLRLRVAEGNE
jgi:hypothetical protein